LTYIFTNKRDLESASFPIKSPAEDFGFKSARKAFGSSPLSVLLDEAVQKRDVREVHKEFESIIRSLFSTLVTYRHGITILLQSSINWPQLENFYVGMVKDFLEKFTEYLNKRIKQGLIRKIPHTPASARLVLETAAWFAVHRHRAMYQTVITEKEAEEAVVDTFLNVFLPKP
jgi:hypothetical protein